MPSSHFHVAAQRHEIELVPAMEHVAAAVHWLENLATQEDWPARTTFGLTLSVDEALTNVVSYAFSDSGDAPLLVVPSLRLICQSTPQGIVVEIRDNGHPFDPLGIIVEPLAQSLDEATAGGHGLRLMHHYLKSITYAREGGWNTLTLVA